MSLHILFVAGYSIGLMILGLWIGRRLRGAADFFVANRSLGPGLIFATMLAANIGAGSTVGATSKGYSDGMVAWWWVGSAGIGSVFLALFIGPSMRRLAEARQLRTVGDYLEYRYSRTLRGVIAVLLWGGSIFLLASQLIGIGWILNVVLDVPKPVGSALGGIVITVYFAAGGLLTSAWVNVVQLAVKMIGFGIAVPFALSRFGFDNFSSVQPDAPDYLSLWRPGLAFGYFMQFAPAFVVSPGLIQKVFGARDDRAVRLGVGLNALGLLAFAIVPPTLGVMARGLYPGLEGNLPLPTLFARALPPIVGALALAAVFSAEISAADASLFMLTTSLSQDLYKRFFAPNASDDRILVVARWATAASGALGVLLAWRAEDLVTTLTIFYSLLSVGLFVPIVGGLYVKRTSNAGALASIAVGLVAMLVVQFATGGAGWGLATPATTGLAASMTTWGISLLIAPTLFEKSG